MLKSLYYNVRTALKVLVENNVVCMDYLSTSKPTGHTYPTGNERVRINGFYSTNSIKRLA